MSPVAQEIGRHTLYGGMMVGFSCLTTLFLNKYTNVTTLGGLPLKTVAKVGLVHGLFYFAEHSSATLLNDKFKDDTKTKAYSVAASNIIITSIQTLVLYKLNAFGCKMAIFAFTITAVPSVVTAYLEVNPIATS